LRHNKSADSTERFVRQSLIVLVVLVAKKVFLLRAMPSAACSKEDELVAER